MTASRENAALPEPRAKGPRVGGAGVRGDEVRLELLDRLHDARLVNAGAERARGRDEADLVHVAVRRSIPAARLVKRADAG